MDEIVDSAPPSRDQGHPALGTTEGIATDASRAIVVETAPTSDGGQHAAAPSPLLETLKAGQFEPTIVRESLDYWKNGSRLSQSEIAQIDNDDRESATAELAALWGDKTADNYAAINAMLDNMPEGDLIRHGRTASGHAIANQPAALARLLGLTRTAGAMIPTGDSRAERAAIESLMRTDRSAYNKDEALQHRYRQLIAQGANP